MPPAPSTQGTAAPGPTEAIERALASEAMARCFQVVAGGTGSPTRVARALDTSKHAVSQHLATLREAGLIQEVAPDTEDGRRKDHRPVWSAFGQLFAHDHAAELALFRDHLLGAEPAGSPGGDRARLVVSGTGRLLLVREHAPAMALEPARVAEAEGRLQHATWAFAQLFRRYLSARSHPTLRAALASAYRELVRQADHLDPDQVLGAFARFQAEHLAAEAPIDELLAEALADPSEPAPGPPDRPEGALDRVSAGRQLGRETADGTYVLAPGAEAHLGPEVRLEVAPSFVHAGRR